jgi:hypothetical protein
MEVEAAVGQLCRYAHEFSPSPSAPYDSRVRGCADGGSPLRPREDYVLRPWTDADKGVAVTVRCGARSLAPADRMSTEDVNGGEHLACSTAHSYVRHLGS